MGVCFIQCGDGEPHPSYISNKSLTHGILFAVLIEGVPELVAVTCQDVEIQNIEDIAIRQIEGVADIRVGIF